MPRRRGPSGAYGWGGAPQAGPPAARTVGGVRGHGGRGRGRPVGVGGRLRCVRVGGRRVGCVGRRGGRFGHGDGGGLGRAPGRPLRSVGRHWRCGRNGRNGLGRVALVALVLCAHSFLLLGSTSISARDPLRTCPVTAFPKARQATVSRTCASAHQSLHRSKRSPGARRTAGCAAATPRGTCFRRATCAQRSPDGDTMTR